MANLPERENADVEESEKTHKCLFNSRTIERLKDKVQMIDSVATNNREALQYRRICHQLEMVIQSLQESLESVVRE